MPVLVLPDHREDGIIRGTGRSGLLAMNLPMNATG